MNIGFHASTAGGLVNAPLEVVNIGCSTFQIFTKSPRQWAAPALSSEDILLFKKTVKANKLYPVVVHTSYLMNLASVNIDLYKKSIDSFATEIARAESIDADYITTHIGNCWDWEKEEATERIINGVKKAVSLSKAKKIQILFENSAKIMSPGGELKRVALLAAKCGKRYGMTLDTCHAFSAGYDLRKQEPLNECLKEVESIAGLNCIKVVHLNDSKGDLGSGLDRHEHLGKGKLGKAGISNIVNHLAFVNAAFILETPKETEASDSQNVVYARKVVK